ncbi:hypothetical protein PIB30_103245, partial [Stylosanthes scabra]|nr:hypothetical protein [Stylosanthes scabra]
MTVVGSRKWAKGLRVCSSGALSVLGIQGLGIRILYISGFSGTGSSLESWRSISSGGYVLAFPKIESSGVIVFDPEIERSLRFIREVRHRIHFENTQYFQREEIASGSDSAYSSASKTDIELPFSDTGTNTMGDLLRITLKQMGGASMALENQP